MAPFPSSCWKPLGTSLQHPLSEPGRTPGDKTLKKHGTPCDWVPLEFLTLRLIHTGPPAARQLWVWSPREAFLMHRFLLLWIVVFCVCLSVLLVFPVTSLLWCIWEELSFGRFRFLLAIKMKVMTFFTCPAGNWKPYHPNRKSIFFCLMIRNSSWNLTSEDKGILKQRSPVTFLSLVGRGAEVPCD